MLIDYMQLKELVENSLVIKAEKSFLNSSQVKIQTVRNSFFPEVSMYVKAENENVKKIGQETSAGLFASVNLFNGFRDVEKSKISKFDYEIKEISGKKTYNELLYSAKLNYWSALKSKEYLKILEEYQDINKLNNSLIVKKVRGGLIPKSEELNSKKIDFNISEEKIKTNNDLNAFKNEIRKMFNVNRNEAIEINGFLDVNIPSGKASVQKIDLSLVEAEENRARSEKISSSLWRLPTINFYVDQSLTKFKNGEILEKSDKEERVVGVKVAVPIFGEKNSESLEESARKLELEGAIQRKKLQVIDRENEDVKKQNTLIYFKNSIERSKEKLDLSREILLVTRDEFKSGLKDADSLNDSADKYIEAKRDFLEHQLEYILAVEELGLNNLNY